MNHSPNYSLIPVKIVINYPKNLNGQCPLCEAPVKFKYNSSEKTIFTLKSVLCVRYHLYVCTNKECDLNNVPFNPTLRFDYSQRNYGRDVFEKIGEYSIQVNTKKRKSPLNPHQILTLLENEYNLPISESTVTRMCDDILILTSFHIDQNTSKIIEKQKFIIVALDGQEPDGNRPALWNFTDIISGRILMTKYLENVDYRILHDCIEELKEKYQKPIRGFLSDKQSSIRKCIEVFYADIPHQYCTYHFSTNLWNHLEKYSNRISNVLQKTVKSLYINRVPVDIKIYNLEEQKDVSLKRLCAPLAKEIINILNIKNDKFKQLKGVLGFEKLTEFLSGFKKFVDKIPIKDRFAKIITNTAEKIEKALVSTKPLYSNAIEGFQMFQQVHKLLWKDKLERNEIIEKLDQMFESIWLRSQQINSKFHIEDRKSFLPNSNTPYWKILAEWTRLWKNYKPGLFKYYDFPLSVKSNVEMEQKFSSEKHSFRSRSGKGHVGQLIQSRGQYILRLQYSSESDIDFDEIIGNSHDHLSYLRKNKELKELRKDLNENIKKSTMRGKNNTLIAEIYFNLLQKIYGLEKTEMGDQSQ